MVGRKLTAKFRTVSSCEYSTEKSYTITDRVLLTFSPKPTRITKQKNKNNKTDSISHDVVAFSPSKTTVLLPYCWRTHNMHNNLHIYDFFSAFQTPRYSICLSLHSFLHTSGGGGMVRYQNTNLMKLYFFFCIWSFYIGVKYKNKKSHPS